DVERMQGVGREGSHVPLERPEPIPTWIPPGRGIRTGHSGTEFRPDPVGVGVERARDEERIVACHGALKGRGATDRPPSPQVDRRPIWSALDRLTVALPRNEP